jgi:hypothetical protein
MQTCVASGQCATRGPKWRRCVFTCGYGCLRGMQILTRGLKKFQTSLRDKAPSIKPVGRLIKRAITHAGRAVWLVCYDWPSGMTCGWGLLDEASLLAASRVYMW